MGFISLKFALFFIVVICLLALIKDYRKQNIVLLIIIAANPSAVNPDVRLKNRHGNPDRTTVL